ARRPHALGLPHHRRPPAPTAPARAKRARIVRCGAPSRRVVVAALLALTLTACRGGAGDTEVRAPALNSHPSGLLKADPAAQVGAGAAKATDPGSIALSGQGSVSGRTVSLGEGLTIFTVAHWGREHFAATLRDEDGRDLAIIAAGTGAYSGSYALALG